VGDLPERLLEVREVVGEREVRGEGVVPGDEGDEHARQHEDGEHRHGVAADERGRTTGSYPQAPLQRHGEDDGRRLTARRAGQPHR
jgi:hypothetical protein